MINLTNFEAGLIDILLTAHLNDYDVDPEYTQAMESILTKLREDK